MTGGRFIEFGFLDSLGWGPGPSGFQGSMLLCRLLEGFAFRALRFREFRLQHFSLRALGV